MVNLITTIKQIQDDMCDHWKEKFIREFLDKLEFLKTYGFEMHKKEISIYGIVIEYKNDNYTISIDTDQFELGSMLGEGYYSFGISKKHTIFEGLRGIYYAKGFGIDDLKYDSIKLLTNLQPYLNEKNYSVVIDLTVDYIKKYFLPIIKDNKWFDDSFKSSRNSRF